MIQNRKRNSSDTEFDSVLVTGGSGWKLVLSLIPKCRQEFNVTRHQSLNFDLESYNNWEFTRPKPFTDIEKLLCKNLKRLIKNRISARNSRESKRQKLRSLQIENSKLKLENKELKREYEKYKSLYINTLENQITMGNTAKILKQIITPFNSPVHSSIEENKNIQQQESIDIIDISSFSSSSSSSSSDTDCTSYFSTSDPLLDIMFSPITCIERNKSHDKVVQILSNSADF